MIKLTAEQSRVIQGEQPVRVVDPRTRTTYVLVREEEYKEIVGQPGPGNGDQVRFEVPAGVQESKQAFLDDLPDLLGQKRNHGKWVCYHGTERIGIGSSQRGLIRRCSRLGFSAGSFYVGMIVPHAVEPEEIEAGPIEFTEIEGA